MASAAGEVFKEFQALARNIDKLTDGQAQVELDDDSGNEAGDSIILLLHVCPNAGPYKGATVKFKICVTSEYPTKAPWVECLNSVYHPNIDISESGEARSICVSLLSEDWQPEVGLDGCVIAILFLFHHPNLDDALSQAFSGTSVEEEDFELNVRASVRGEEVEGISYDSLINEDCSTDNENDNLEGEVGVSSVNDSDQYINVDTTESALNAQGSDSFASKDTDLRTEKATKNTNPGELIDSEKSTNTTAEIATTKASFALQKIDQSRFLSETEETGSQTAKTGCNERPKEDEVSFLPQTDNKILLRETQPWEIYSYNWRNLAFSFCYLLKRFYHRLQKKV